MAETWHRPDQYLRDQPGVVASRMWDWTVRTTGDDGPGQPALVASGLLDRVVTAL